MFMLFATGANAATGDRSGSEPKFQHQQLSYRNDLDYSSRGQPDFCAKEEDNCFLNPARFRFTLGILFYFATR